MSGQLYIGEEAYDDFEGPIPPKGSRVWAGGWFVVEKVEYYCNKSRIGRPARVEGLVYLRPEADDPAAPPTKEG